MIPTAHGFPIPRFFFKGNLVDTRVRASNEGSPRPRVARAQKIISLHPPFFSILLD
jgi:hypothetical protein